jgi:outer membrane protein assembly factor BamB
MKKHLISILVLFLLLSTSFVGVSNQTKQASSNKSETPTDGGLQNSSWPMFHHDARHTGRSPYAPIDYQPAVKWKFHIKGMTVSSPAIDKNGTIYIGAEDFQKSFFAINPNGTEKWHFASNGWIDASPAIGDDGIIYSGSMNGDLIAFYPNGTIKWRTHIGASWVYSSPVIDDNGTIYVASTGSSRLGAVDPNGTIKWFFYAEDDIYCSPALSDDGTIYDGSNDGYLYAINPDGTLKWKFYSGGEKGVGSAPSIADDGMIYFGGTSGYLYALYPNGTLRWKIGTGYIGGSSPAIGIDGTIYVGDQDNYRIYSIAPNGSTNWYYHTNGEIISSPTIDKNGIVYCGSMDGNLYAFYPNGTLRWKFNTGNGITSSPIIGEDGTIYIANWGGSLYAFGRGELQVEANGPYNGDATIPIQFTGTVYGGILPYSYHWDFGDGQTSNKQNPTHNFSAIGNYTATFTVTDNEGNSSSDTANVTISYALPTVTITKPVNGLYIMDTRILPLRKCIIIGQITIEADAHQEPLGIARVEFSIDNKLKSTDTEAPYNWIWRSLSFSKHTITVTAYDNSGKCIKSSISVSKIF